MSVYRNELFPGLVVDIVQKHHQRSGELTRGEVLDLLTSKGFHSRGIKVRIVTKAGEEKVGRVQHIIGFGPELEREGRW